MVNAGNKVWAKEQIELAIGQAQLISGWGARRSEYIRPLSKPLL